MFVFKYKRQDADDKLRRIKSDRESLATQVQLLSEQVSAQTDRIDELERLLNDKTHLISDTEDLLQRVCQEERLHWLPGLYSLLTLIIIKRKC